MAPLSFDENPVFPGIPESTGIWLAQMVERLCGGGGEKGKLISMNFQRLDENQGYLSIVAKLKLKWASQNGHEESLPSSVVLKIPTFSKLGDCGPSNDDNNETLANVHNNECYCYSFFAHLNLPKPVLIPKVFGFSKIEFSGQNNSNNNNNNNGASFLLMEDLSERGRTVDWGDGLTLEQCKVVIENIASLHAYCFANPDWNSAGKFQPPSPADCEKFEPMLIARMDQLLECVPTIFSDIGVSMDEVWQLYSVEGLTSCLTQDVVYPVLCHGDLWANNIIFGSVPNNARRTSEELVAIIDWQLAYQGCCTSDLGRMLISSLDWKMRRENEEFLLEYYYKCLQAKMPSSFQVPYTLDEVKRLYYETSFLGYTQFFICTAPLFLSLEINRQEYKSEEIANFVKRVQAAFEDARKHVTNRNTRD